MTKYFLTVCIEEGYDEFWDKVNELNQEDQGKLLAIEILSCLSSHGHEATVTPNCIVEEVTTTYTKLRTYGENDYISFIKENG